MSESTSPESTPISRAEVIDALATTIAEFINARGGVLYAQQAGDLAGVLADAAAGPDEPADIVSEQQQAEASEDTTAGAITQSTEEAAEKPAPADPDAQL
jgi:hypothetical protein